MLRVALLLIVAVAAALASWQVISTDPGSLTLRWGQTEIVTSGLFDEDGADRLPVLLQLLRKVLGVAEALHEPDLRLEPIEVLLGRREQLLEQFRTTVVALLARQLDARVQARDAALRPSPPTCGSPPLTCR